MLGDIALGWPDGVYSPVSTAVCVSEAMRPENRTERWHAATMLCLLALAASSSACLAGRSAGPTPIRGGCEPATAIPSPGAADPNQACETDSDCVFSAVWRCIESADDCQWSCCDGAVMNRSAAERFQTGFRRWCAGQSAELQARCASATCEMRGQPRCRKGRCAELQP